MKYDVFISYSRKDYVDEQKNVIPGNVVSKVKEALTNAGITYWFDEEGIYSGNVFTEKIVTNIEASTIFLFLSTKDANASRWTSKEVACADEMRKYILPVRIDDTPYNKKVLFRIADRSFIDYKANPEKGMAEMVESIKKYLEQEKEEEKKRLEAERIKEEQERKKEEEIRRQKEREEKRRQQEQEELIKSIRLTNKALNNDEKKLLIERDNLLLKAENVSDTEKRAELKKDIQESGPISQKFQEERLGLVKEIETLKDSVEVKDAEIQRISNEKAKSEVNLKGCLERLEQKEKARLQAENEIKHIRKDNETRLKEYQEKYEREEKAKCDMEKKIMRLTENEDRLRGDYHTKLMAAEQAKRKMEVEKSKVEKELRNKLDEEAKCKAEKERKDKFSEDAMDRAGILFGLYLVLFLIADGFCWYYYGLHTGLILLISTLSLVIPFFASLCAFSEIGKKNMTAVSVVIYTAFLIESAMGVYIGEVYKNSQWFYVIMSTILFSVTWGRAAISYDSDYWQTLAFTFFGLVIPIGLLYITNLLLTDIHQWPTALLVIGVWFICSVISLLVCFRTDEG